MRQISFTNTNVTMPQTNKLKQRVATVDIVKCFAIMAVVLLHCDIDWQDRWLPNLLGWSWHNEVFFLLAGFFTISWRRIGKLYLMATACYVTATLLHNVFIYVGLYPEGGSHPGTGEPFVYWGFQEHIVALVKAVFCMGRQYAMGAMWFVYALLFALSGVKIVHFVFQRLRLGERPLVLFLFILQTVSWALTTYWHFTIPRVNNAVTCMLLIEIGHLLYTNRERFMPLTTERTAVSLSVFVAFSTIFGGFVMNKNYYHDPLTLEIMSVSALLTLLYIAKLLEHTLLGKALSLIGRHTFAIMAWHPLVLVALGLVRI